MTDHGIWQIQRDDPLFPDVLRTIPDPPSSLHGIGDASLLRWGLGIVGSRRATPYGTACAERFAGVAARLGVVTVSGGARGCDSAAHRGALRAEGPTVAVLGCGPDIDYPASEAALLARIREVGCVVAELPPGHPPRRWAFPRRNRLIAGLSRCVLVVEAGLPSGTFSTADHALDAGRDVLAVPGSILAPGSAGTNRLIRAGAQAITCDEDLVDALGYMLPPAGAEQANTRTSSSGAGSSAVDAPLLDALVSQPHTIDGLAVALRTSVTDVARDVSRLESEGLVSRYPDGTYGPSKKLVDGAL